MIYADTSFLFALYQPSDVFHAKAYRLISRLRKPMVLTLLGELELLNNLYRGLAVGVIGRQLHDMILRQISEDETEGILVRQAVNEIDLYKHARELARKFVPAIPLRSLDILHVSAAQLLGVSHFVSFDQRQHLLARKVGLRVLPLPI
jgi:predicted nucleic acid-binding protein